ncbi:MAG: phosphosulfolactate synthase [Burkholderiaceae bacterium]|nr:phosphosulfolactate synthase [Rhodoferax sp.]MCP5285201.1 phosphosulfolactate synthase [Burkholderiaceae bacterium]
MSDHAFASIPVPQRQDKPRTRGLNMMIDWGMGLARQADTLESAGPYIDNAKIAASIPRVMPRDVLAKKLALYKDHGISPMIGGLFTELAYMQGNADKLFDEALAVGFGALEVSDNLISYPPGEKARLIRACRSAGLKAYGEVGRKEGALDDDSFIADIADCLDAGASGVYLEAYELFAQGQTRTELIERIGTTFPAEHIVYELPVVILPGVHREFKHRIASWLVRTLGTEVNLANIEWDEIYITEIVRRGMAGDASHPDGAYRLAGFAPSEHDL